MWSKLRTKGKQKENLKINFQMTKINETPLTGTKSKTGKEQLNPRETMSDNRNCVGGEDGGGG